MNKANVYNAKEWEQAEAWARIGKGKFQPENFLVISDILVYQDFQVIRFTVEELRDYLQEYYVFKEYEKSGPSTKFEIIGVK